MIDASLIGIIKVQHGHASDEEELLELVDLVGKRWCEVKAVDVIRCMAHNVPIPVATHMADICTECHDRNLRTLATTKATLLHSHSITKEIEEATKQLVLATEAHIQAQREQQRALERKRLVERGGRYVLEHGKYAGISLEILVDEDVAYVACIAKHGRIPLTDGETLELPTTLVHAAQKLMTGRCCLCGSRMHGNWCIGCWTIRAEGDSSKKETTHALMSPIPCKNPK